MKMAYMSWKICKMLNERRCFFKYFTLVSTVFKQLLPICYSYVKSNYCHAINHKQRKYNIGIKHGFSCTNIRQVPWEVLKTETEDYGFQYLQRDLANVNALKNHVRSLLLHKNWNICNISRYFLHYFVSPFQRCLANVISTNYARSRTWQYTSRKAANLWPRYDHIESCVAVH